MGFVLPRWIIFAQPAALVGRPVIQVGSRRLGEQRFAYAFVQVIDVVVELRCQLLAADRA